VEALGHPKIETTVAPRVGTLARILATLRGWQLDRELSDGADPRSSALLTARAAQLTRRDTRDALAGRLEGALRASRRSPAMPTAAIQPPRIEVEAALALLTQAAAMLRTDGPIYCQGVARLRLLLSDGASPLYYASEPGELSKEAEAIVMALGGRP